MTFIHFLMIMHEAMKVQLIKPFIMPIFHLFCWAILFILCLQFPTDPSTTKFLNIVAAFSNIG